MEIVPKITTVDTATAVLCGSHLTTGSAPKTAAAPQMALPVEVSSARSLSIFSHFPKRIPSKIVMITIIKSIKIAGSPIAITLCKVSLKPYSTIPVRSTCFVQN